MTSSAALPNCNPSLPHLFTTMPGLAEKLRRRDSTKATVAHAPVQTSRLRWKYASTGARI